MPSARRLAARLLLALPLAGGALWFGSLLAVVLAANLDAARPAQAIIVLGAAQYDGRPSPVLRARLDHGIALWRRGLAPRLIVTGGSSPGDRTSEAATGRRYAVAHGVPDSAILMESEGRTTAASLRAAAVLLAEMERTAAARPAAARPAPPHPAPSHPAARATAARTAPPPGAVDSADGGRAVRLPRSAILVSDPFHMLRLGVLARRYGIVAYGSPTRTSPISDSPRLAWRYMLRESLKVPFVILMEQSDDDE